MHISTNMRSTIEEIIEIPGGITCELKARTIVCTKGGVTLMRMLNHPAIEAHLESNRLILRCAKANKTHRCTIAALKAHLRNIFSGLEQRFTYVLEACNVHFPMTAKLEKNRLGISNFLGERTTRIAEILPDVSVEIKEQKSPTSPFRIMVSSHNREAAGQTAANIEKATRVKNRDRRVFQDGIFIIERPQRSIP